MSQKFQAGETVQRKNGGPIMTVQHYDPDDPKLVHCVWNVRAKTFPETHHEDQLVRHNVDQLKISSL